MTGAEWLTSDDPRRMLETVRGSTITTPGSLLPVVRISDRKLLLFAAAVLGAGRDRGWEGSVGDHADECVRDVERWAETGVPPEDGWWEDEERQTPASVAGQMVGWGPKWSVTGAEMAAMLREIVGNPWRPVTLPTVRGRCPACRGKGDVRKVEIYASRWDREACGSCGGGGMVPFSPWLAWSDGAVPKMARVIYDARSFDQLPILADALEDAGCGEEKCRDCDGTGAYFGPPTRMKDGSTWHYGGKCRTCPTLNDEMGTGRVPNPILEHLRALGPHVRGCWVLDLLTGKG